MPITAALSRINVCSTKTRDMNATVDALTDLEHRLTEALSDALSAAECARLEFEARLAFALEAAVPAVPAGGVMEPCVCVATALARLARRSRRSSSNFERH